MKIAIAGGSGFVGTHLANSFHESGHDIFILSRNKKKNQAYPTIQWLTEGSTPDQELPAVDAFILLAGVSINGRWTKSRKEAILQSRLHATKEAVRLMASMETKPKVFISASAIGYYGISEQQTFTEESAPERGGFLQHVCQRWEQEAESAAALGVRTVIARFGLILANDGGALPRLMLPYRLFAGGALGSGNQWYSWIHISDVVNMIEWIMKTDVVEGAVNVTAPHPVQMREFGRALAKQMKRPYFLNVPAFAIKIAMGEMSELVLQGQKVLPKKAERYGYPFLYPTLEQALAQLI